MTWVYPSLYLNSTHLAELHLFMLEVGASQTIYAIIISTSGPRQTHKTVGQLQRLQPLRISYNCGKSEVRREEKGVCVGGGGGGVRFLQERGSHA